MSEVEIVGVRPCQQDCVLTDVSFRICGHGTDRQFLEAESGDLELDPVLARDENWQCRCHRDWHLTRSGSRPRLPVSRSYRVFTVFGEVRIELAVDTPSVQIAEIVYNLG